MHTILIFHNIHFSFLFNFLIIKKQKHIKTVNIPCHRYRTRANNKRMDNEVQESMKADIDQLKTQMGQMFEMMVALKDAVTVRNEEAQSSHPPLLQHSNLNVGNRNIHEPHLYGMPSNYEPVYEEYEEQGEMPMGNAANPKGQLEATQNTTC